eukprot:NODE_10519_length_1346_cov_3.388843.p1 GENE.NODE_10519_length_1346_cov_3.388843~~NODE_10519_length_1346_cov_3.388843.p1  ORF type:complete len:424 (+),score=114.11 NODE_10519_length_1346_cov_3.388843:113-1273(+)
MTSHVMELRLRQQVLEMEIASDVAAGEPADIASATAIAAGGAATSVGGGNDAPVCNVDRDCMSTLGSTACASQCTALSTTAGSGSPSSGARSLGNGGAVTPPPVVVHHTSPPPPVAQLSTVGGGITPPPPVVVHHATGMPPPSVQQRYHVTSAGAATPPQTQSQVRLAWEPVEEKRGEADTMPPSPAAGSTGASAVWPLADGRRAPPPVPVRGTLVRMASPPPVGAAGRLVCSMVTPMMRHAQVPGSAVFAPPISEVVRRPDLPSRRTVSPAAAYGVRMASGLGATWNTPSRNMPGGVGTGMGGAGAGAGGAGLTLDRTGGPRSMPAFALSGGARGGSLLGSLPVGVREVLLPDGRPMHRTVAPAAAATPVMSAVPLLLPPNVHLL